MENFDFTLRFQHTLPLDEVLEALSEIHSECIIGVGRPGIFLLDFSKEAESLEEAVETAIADIKKTLPHVNPRLVS